MSSNDNLLDLVRQAQLGSKESMDELVDIVQPRVSAYINRLTLEHDLAQDLSQQTLLTMIESLKRLTFEYSEQFWAWLYRTAQGKVMQHYRRRSKEKSSLAVVHQERLLQTNSEDANDGLSETVRNELSTVISKAMARLKLKQRSVLALRCYEQMPYSQIAGIVGCSEVRARGLFFQAKLSLKRQLVRSGLSKSMLLTGLWLFGRMTSEGQAASEATRVTLASTKVGVVGTLVGAAGTKLGITIATMLATGILVVGAAAVRNDTESTAGFAVSMLPQRSEVKSFHFVQQSWNRSGGANNNLTRGRSLSRGAYEQWYFFPDGVEGSMFMMMQRWDPRQENKLCGWLQNSSGNYYYHSGRGIIYRYDYRLFKGSFKTRRLPSDAPDFIEFLDQVEGDVAGESYTRDPKTGLLVGALDRTFYNARTFESSILYNTLDEKTFDSFRYPWPQDSPVVDERDKMHTRGWTYFGISGQINGKEVRGYGQIPFIYDLLSERRPWLKLSIGESLEIVDGPSGAYLIADEGQVIAAYLGGSFFRGLARPWAGMHAIDTIRRDAAEKRIRFTLRKFGGDDDHYGKAEITLLEQIDAGQIQIAYTVDIDKDIIEELEFFVDGDGERKEQGVLRFTYLEDIEQSAEEYPEPTKIEVQSTKYRDSVGMLWLIELARGALGQ